MREIPPLSYFPQEILRLSLSRQKLSDDFDSFCGLILPSLIPYFFAFFPITQSRCLFLVENQRIAVIEAFSHIQSRSSGLTIQKSPQMWLAGSYVCGL